MSCSLTILSGVKNHKGTPIATKTHTKVAGGWSTQPYLGGYLHHVLQREIKDVVELARLLRKLEDLPHHFVVRGEPLRPSGHAGIPRQYKGDAPSFKEVDRRWLGIDIDGAPQMSPEEFIRTHMPEYFHGIACYYQFSSSYGIKNKGLCLHLWYFLDRPASSFSLREWAKTIPYVDSALYNPVQPHYTARPIFVGGDDPVEKRSGVVKGVRSRLLSLPESVVDNATFEANRAAEVKVQQERLEPYRRAAALNPFSGDEQKRYAELQLARACDDIINAPTGERNKTVFGRAAWVGNLLPYLDENKAEAMLLSAASTLFGGSGEGEVAVYQGLNAGRHAPYDLSHIGAGTKDLEKYGQGNLAAKKEKDWSRYG